MSRIRHRLGEIRDRIRELESRHGRVEGSVRLLAVSKTKPAEDVREAYRAGQSEFGENHLQDALTKIEPLAELPVRWHFIGPIQSNKTREIASRFDWVQSLDRDKIARRLNDHRPPDRPPLDVCIQVNISGERSKSGLPVGQVEALVDTVLALPRLSLRGLMTIPQPESGLEAQRRPFARLRELMGQLNARGLNLDTLSIGMTDDLEAAIAEGATLVRIGTAIFGKRD